ncbi:unnamed protein product [Larinioides sclopetarius]|uniref:Uncharacterized protein n=1 Tax=Larinioides sclopetarius TaxID=280406 RepID=A0AAV2BZR1_9ARAC
MAEIRDADQALSILIAVGPRSDSCTVKMNQESLK